jgi:hypothetical protein
MGIFKISVGQIQVIAMENEVVSIYKRDDGMVTILFKNGETVGDYIDYENGNLIVEYIQNGERLFI